MLHRHIRRYLYGMRSAFDLMIKSSFLWICDFVLSTVYSISYYSYFVNRFLGISRVFLQLCRSVQLFHINHSNLIGIINKVFTVVHCGTEIALLFLFDISVKLLTAAQYE